jgi:D-sedoheptulose 7-phosphate isomerase
VTHGLTFIKRHLDETKQIIDGLDHAALAKMIDLILELRENGGRLFLLGVGGGAGHASHAVNDFRKLAGIESYCPSDNVSELTARTNDEGWDTTYVEWLKTSRLSNKDMIFVFSVGGGDATRNISANLVRAVQLAKTVGSKIIGVVGRDGGYTATVADACVIVPTVNAASITPHTESLQAVVWHLLVSDPRVQALPNKWERSV